MIQRLLRGSVRGVATAAAICVVATGLIATNATAGQLGLQRYGPRLGLSFDPDQFTLGAFADFGELAASTHLRTSADLGLGDHLTSFLINGDVAYHIAPGELAFVPYVGGGLTVAYYNFDIDTPPGVSVDDTETEIGLSIVVGGEMDLGGYKAGSLELRFGIDELPDVKLTAALGFF